MSADNKKSALKYLKTLHARALADLLSCRDREQMERLRADLARIVAELTQAER
jgi:hypothetical protein